MFNCELVRKLAGLMNYFKKVGLIINCCKKMDYINELLDEKGLNVLNCELVRKWAWLMNEKWALWVSKKVS